MLRSPVPQTVALLILPFGILLALQLLIEGHNRPGGGFIAGVLMAVVITLQFITRGRGGVSSFLQLPYRWVLGFGLLLAGGMGALSLLLGYPFLTGLRGEWTLPLFHIPMSVSIVLMFDVGIFVLVIGALVLAILSLGED
ncbi:MAG: MnhB domain-containing protein [Dehalococcoidia bacterium]